MNIENISKEIEKFWNSNKTIHTKRLTSITIKNVQIAAIRSNDPDFWVIKAKASNDFINQILLLERSIANIPNGNSKQYSLLTNEFFNLKYRKNTQYQFVTQDGLNMLYKPESLKPLANLTIKVDLIAWRTPAIHGLSLRPVTTILIDELPDPSSFTMYNTLMGDDLMFLETSIRARLAKFNPEISFEQLIKILKTTNGHLSGGFLLACLLQSDQFVDKKFTDIDIFIPANQNPVYHSKNIWGPDCVKGQKLCSEYSTLKGCNTPVVDVLNLKNGVQFIMINPVMFNDIHAYITKNFDLSFLTSSYSIGERGSQFHMPVNFGEIFRKQGQVQYNGYISEKSRSKRLLKYFQRRFYIENSDQISCNLSCLTDWNGEFYVSLCGHATHLNCARLNAIPEFKTYLATNLFWHCYECFDANKKILLAESCHMIEDHHSFLNELINEYLKTVHIPEPINLLILQNQIKRWQETAFNLERRHHKKVIKISENLFRDHIFQMATINCQSILRNIETVALEEINQLLNSAQTLNKNLNTQLTVYPSFKRQIQITPNQQATTCIICLAPATKLFVPCGHYITCENCCGEIIKGGSCPVCRQKIEQAIKVFI